MSSKTILIGLSIFWFGGEKFAAWCKLVSKECRFNDHAGKCGVVRFTTQFFFILDKAKPLPIRI